jgi:hypothetical protein
MTDKGPSADVPIQAPVDPAPKPVKSAAASKKAAAPKETSHYNEPAGGTKKSAAPKPASSAKSPKPGPDADNEEGLRSAYSGESGEDPDPESRDSDSEASSPGSGGEPGGEESSSEEDYQGLPLFRSSMVPDPFSTEWY